LQTHIIQNRLHTFRIILIHLAAKSNYMVFICFFHREDTILNLAKLVKLLLTKELKNDIILV